MGRYSRKVHVNQVRRCDKNNDPKGKPLTNRQIHNGMKLYEKAYKQAERDFDKVERITKAYHLLFTLVVLRKIFKFTPVKMLEFCKRWRNFYDSMYFKDGAEMSDIHGTVIGTNKNEGELCYTDYKLNKFDENQDEFERMPGATNYIKLLNYCTKENSVGCMNAAEGAAMITLFDYFGFAKIRLKRYIEKVRLLYKINVQEQLISIKYIENVLHQPVPEFDIIRDPNKKILQAVS